MTTTDPGGAQVGQDLVDLFSPEWCVKAIEVWNEVVIPHLADPDNYHYVAEWKDTDTDAICQFKAAAGRIVTWEAGKTYNDEDCDFILWAKHDIWKKVADGVLDPVGAVASKRIHMRKGPMTVVIKEADGFKRLLVAYGRIATNW
jgi:putative sterol carrier protein